MTEGLGATGRCSQTQEGQTENGRSLQHFGSPLGCWPFRSVARDAPGGKLDVLRRRHLLRRFVLLILPPLTKGHQNGLVLPTR